MKRKKKNWRQKNYLNYVRNQPGEKMIAKANCLSLERITVRPHETKA